MKKIFLAIIACATFASVSFSGTNNVNKISTSTPTVARATIVKGYTLWGISKKVYDNPYLWPSLWEVNKSTISNPHIINVGQSISLPPKEDIKKIKPSVPPPEFIHPLSKSGKPAVASSKVKVVKVAEETTSVNNQKVEKDAETSAPPSSSSEKTSLAVESAVAGGEEPAALSPEGNKETLTTTAPAESSVVPTETSPAASPSSDTTPPPKAEKISASDIKSAPLEGRTSVSSPQARIVGANYIPDGIIVGMKEDKLLTSQGDIVYASFPFVKVSQGDRMGIYRRTGKKIYDPSDGRYLGDELVRVGTAVVESVSSSSKGEGTSSGSVVKILISSEPIEKRDYLIIEK